MLSFPFPFTSTRINFVLPLSFLPQYLRVVVLLLLLASIFVLVIWLYRVELRRVNARTARGLIVLRLGIVVTIFVLMTGSPIVTRHLEQAIPGRVLIAVDCSGSMRVADPDRPLGEKLRIARSLRLHDGVTSDEQLDAWIASHETSGDVPLPPPDTDSGIAQRAMLDEVKFRASTLNRLQSVQRLLRQDGAALLDRIGKTHAIDLVGFTQTLTDMPPDAELPWQFTTPADTDLKLPLQRGIDSPGEKALLGAVIFTDGQHNWGDSPIALAKTLASKGVPIYPVNVAPREPSSDVAVIAVSPIASTVSRGSTVPVIVKVRFTRWPAGRIEVLLKTSDGRAPLTQVVTHDGADRVHEAAFNPKFDRSGIHTITVEARTPTPDPRPGNNSRTARVTVVDYKPRVLLIDGDARWEYRYIHSALLRSRDPELEVKSVLYWQPRFHATPDVEAEQAGLPWLKLPDNEDALAGYDCVILGDVTGEQLPLKDRQRLERYVSDQGGTLIVVAGKRFMPIGLSDSTSDGDPLRNLLPIRNPRAFVPQLSLGESGFRPEITPEGRRAWFLRLADGPEQDRVIWSALPQHEWAAVGEPKEVAEVLGVVPRSQPRLPMIPEQTEKPAVMIARQSYGFGRVLYLGLDSTWRWRFKVGDEHHHRFWKQCVQWAASDRLLPAQNQAGTIRFGPRESTIRSGQEVELLLRVTNDLPKLTATAVKVVRVLRLAEAPDQCESVVNVIPLHVQDAVPQEHTATVRDLPPGRYAVVPEIPEWSNHLRGTPGPDGRPIHMRATFEVLPPDSDEMTELTANLPLLDSLAATTGGRLFDLADVGELVDVLSRRTAINESEVAIPLRRSWWTLALIAVLLTAEWVVRKRSGLA